MVVIMQSNGFSVEVLVNDQVKPNLHNGEVQIPFGSEYSIKCVNNNPRRAVAKLNIDGDSVGNYLIHAYESINIKRPVAIDCAFKFVDLDSTEAKLAGKSDANYNKIKGTIVVKFQLEKVSQYAAKGITRSYNSSWAKPIPSDKKYYLRNDIKDGCTVGGSVTGEKFTTVNVDTEDNETEIRLFLRGYYLDSVINFPNNNPLVNVAASEFTANNMNFCGRCGLAVSNKTDLYCIKCGNKF